MLESLFPGGLTGDALLGGRVKITQPKGGYRVAVDPVLLAAAVPARGGDRVADLGAGTGGVALCLAARVEGCTVCALEQEADLTELARANAAANGWSERIGVRQGDVTAPPFAPESFDHAAMNPPYLTAGRATAPAERLRRVAAVEGNARLPDWIAAAWALVRKGGSVSMIHRADRLDEILGAFAGLQTGGGALYPVQPKAGEPARRVIVRYRKGDGSPFVLQPALTLHEASGAFTAPAEKILRGGWDLDAALASL